MCEILCNVQAGTVCNIFFGISGEKKEDSQIDVVIRLIGAF